MLKLVSYLFDLSGGSLGAFSSLTRGSAWPLSRGLASSGFIPKRKQGFKSQLHPDDHFLPTVCLIGRPNVGKSQLFNKLMRKVAALVYDTPSSHVTRDYKEGIGKLGDLRFKVRERAASPPSSKPHPSRKGD